MTPDSVMILAKNAIYLILIVCSPILAITLITGLAVSIFQATTQIQEQTLAFVPKIIAALLSLILFGSWMISKIIDFTAAIFGNLHKFIG